jgi:hypothetical protein
METVMIPNAFPAAIPPYANPVPQGGAWRPAAHAALRAYPVTRPAQQHWRPAPIQLGQQQPTAAASIAKGADVLFSLLTAVGAMTVGIAAMTVGIGGDSKASPPVKPSPTWKWIGGITAALGAVMILSNVSKISKASEMVAPTASVQIPQ